MRNPLADQHPPVSATTTKSAVTKPFTTLGQSIPPSSTARLAARRRGRRYCLASEGGDWVGVDVRPYPRAVRLPRLSAAQYRRITLVVVLAVCAIIVTGAAVRLTDSGLGCSDWPNCTRNHFVAKASVPPAGRVHSTAIFTGARLGGGDHRRARLGRPPVRAGAT